MATLHCAEQALAVGIDWAFVEDKSEVKAQLKQATGKQYVVASSDEGMLLGLSEADKAAKNRTAAGLLVGKLLPDAIVYEALDQERIWVCAVRGGLPLPGMDKVTDAGEALQVVADVRTYAHTPVTVVGSHPEASMTLAALMEQVEPSMLASCKLRKASDGERTKFYGVLAMAFCLIAWGIWEFRPQTDELDEDYDEIVHETGGAAEADDRSRDQQLIKQARQKFLQRPDMASVTALWADVLNRLPYAVGGYRPALTECRNHQCMLQWNWRAAQFERQYLDLLPGERQPSKNPGEYIRQVQTRIPLRSAGTRELRGITVDEMDNWAIDLITQVTRAGGRADILPPNQAVNVSLPPLRERGQPRSQLIGHEGRITVMASGWGNIQSVFSVLAQQDLIPERAVFNINGSTIGLQMEAKYVVPN
ncbi:hypothetical protein AXE65_06410 [Ventosimonas gracilis]|uniref:Type 4b pilus protein PilO2 n=1 Tax=Ventosimonas gracilis TaxID=1680762 RepID=A0A139SLK1_9GAMM|nr:type 4b pilus protein PilO2 [Ventosimonas gracilis]KXU35364.1 hypothetical protein AXE65_06410 [Ventosimonas gracilis]